MCQASPGPRCSPHAEEQLKRSRHKLARLRAEHAAITAAIDEAVNQMSYLSDEEIDSLRARQQQIQEQIDDQIDKVAADRDAWWTTPEGRKDLQSQIEKQRAANNLRAVHTLTARLERAEQEYEQRIFAGKIAKKERKHLKESIPAADYAKYVSSTLDQRRALRRTEVYATEQLKELQQRLRACRNVDEARHVREQVTSLTRTVREAQTSRRRLEEADYARRAGISGFAKVDGLPHTKTLNDGQHYLRLTSADFGAARDYFPTGALVRIKSSRRDEVGNTVVKLETGDERLIYSDSLVVKATR